MLQTDRNPDLHGSLRRVGGLALAAALLAALLLSWAAAPCPAQDGPPSYQLRNVSWRALEQRLEQIWGQQLLVSTQQNGRLATLSLPTAAGRPFAVHIDRRSNLVSVQGSDRMKHDWERLFQAIDVPPNDPDQVNEVIPSRRADPAKVQKVVSLLRSLSRETQPEPPSAALKLADRNRARQWGGQLVSMIFQPAKPAQAPTGQQQARQPGQAVGPPDQKPPEPSEGEQEGGLIGPVQVEFLEELGQIIIRGNPRDVERVKKIIDQIVQQSQLTQPEVAIYRLKYVDSRALAEVVSPIYEEVYEPRQGSVNITALAKPNALLLVGPKENIERVISLIRQLDQPVPPRTRFEVFQLRYMSAQDAAQRIITFFQAAGEGAVPGQQQAAAAGQELGGLAARIRVVADYRSNSVIVQASPSDLAEVARFLRKIDVIDSKSVNEVRIFKLRNALAEELAPVLQDALNGQLQGAGQGLAGVGAAAAQRALPGQAVAGQQQYSQIRSAMLSLMTVDAKTGKLLKSGIMFDVRVTADTNSNSLVVTGPAENMELIGALIKQLDQLPDAVAQIKVFTIINGDATTLLDMLQTLFGQQGVGAQAGALGQLPLQTGAGETSLVPLRFAIDVRTNSIIASGSEGDLNVVEALLTRLDLEEVEERRTTVYRLRNAPALDVADAINQLLEGQRTINQIDPNVISPFEQIEREVIVVPELVSNSLIVSATPKYYDEIRRIVEELDRRPPMVMIQVLIAEVTLNETEEFGVELGIQDSLLFDRGIGVIGFPFNQSGIGNNADAVSLATRDAATGQALANFAVGRVNANLGYGGLVLSAGSDSVNVLLRALHNRGRVQILSRPQVMTLDNIGAFVQVGARVARVSSVSQNQAGGTTFSAPDVNVGILLGVTPRTSPDGMIVMEINAEKSELGPEEEGTPIFVDAQGNIVRSPPINVTTAQTTVSAQSGQTVVFAGLITKDNNVVRRGIPYVSDWPVLGPLLRFDSEVNQRTELLIILTPYILESDEDLQWINQREAERMSWCLADVIEVHGETSFTGGYGFAEGQQPEVIYPDLNPTGTDSPPKPKGADGPTPPAPNQPKGPAPSSRRAPTVRQPSTAVTIPPDQRPVRTAQLPAWAHAPATGPHPAGEFPRISRLPATR